MRTLIHEYANERKRKGYSQRTIADDLLKLVTFADFITETYPDAKEITEITKDMIRSYEKQIAVKKDKEGKLFTNERKMRYLSAVKNFFLYLHIHEKIYANPAGHIVYPRDRQRIIKDVLTPEEMETLLKTVTGTKLSSVRDRAILELLYSSGIRSEELCSIHVSDIDLDEKVLFVRKGKLDKERVIPFGETAKQWICRYLEKVRPLIAQEWAPELFVSITQGERLSTARLYDIITYWAKKSGVEKKVNTHTFRHSCAAHMLKGRADIRYVQKQLGHKSIQTTEKYLKIEITDLKEIHERCHPREQDTW
jgi:integrase/recombinase XerD